MSSGVFNLRIGMSWSQVTKYNFSGRREGTWSREFGIVSRRGFSPYRSSTGFPFLFAGSQKYGRTFSSPLAQAKQCLGHELLSIIFRQLKFY